jgi:DNA primase
MPSGKDPADVISEEGAEKFAKRVSGAAEASRWLFNTFGNPVRDSAMPVRLKAFEEIAGYLSAFKSHPMYEELQEKAAIAFNLNISALGTVLSQHESGRSAAGIKIRPGLEAILKGGEQVERTLFLSLMACPHYLGEVRNLLDIEDFDHPLHRRLARIIFQPGFSIGSAHNLQKLKDVTNDEELYSYVVRLVIEHEEDMAVCEAAKYTEDVLKLCLIHMLKKQFEAESKRFQSAMAQIKAESEDAGQLKDCQEKLLALVKEKLDLESDYRDIVYKLGGEKLLTEEDLANPC